MVLPLIVKGSHHSQVSIHTHQTVEQRLQGEHQYVEESDEIQPVVVPPRILIGKEHRNGQTEYKLADGQVEGEEVCRKDSGNP